MHAFVTGTSWSHTGIVFNQIVLQMNMGLTKMPVCRKHISFRGYCSAGENRVAIMAGLPQTDGKFVKAPYGMAQGNQEEPDTARPELNGQDATWKRDRGSGWISHMIPTLPDGVQ